LGVAFADEGMELRQAGITMPIMVMNPEEKSFAQMLKFGLEPEIYSTRILNAFNKAVESEGVDSVLVHLKIDTGMFRLGFLEHEVDQLLHSLSGMPRLKVQSVFSHLVGSDEAKHDAFTLQQIEKFNTVCHKLKTGLGYDFWRHILNSAGVERFPQAQFEMVRLGIGLYGISAVGDKQLENVTTLKTYISQIKSVSAIESIGYGRAGNIGQDGCVAIIPIGYADGLNRHLSRGRGKVLIRKKLVPIVGNICMDMCMVDVTGLPDVEEGDEVIVFGDDHKVSEMARVLETIPYEVLTGISRRVKRIYFKE
jgi:alanine racemase